MRLGVRVILIRLEFYTATLSFGWVMVTTSDYHSPKAICKSFPPSTLVLCSGSVHCHRSRSKPLNSRFCICYSIQLGWCMKLVGTAWTVKCFSSSFLIFSAFVILLGWCMKLVGTAWTVKCFVIYPGSAFTIQLNESTELKLLLSFVLGQQKLSHY